MPRLLKNGEVQLHMPKTGGTSLAVQIGVKEVHLSAHLGAEFIPERWSDRPTVATIRDRKSWRRSMTRYLKAIGKPEQAKNFRVYRPADVIGNLDLDPTFGYFSLNGHAPEWLLTICQMDEITNWYQAYKKYYLEPADRIIQMENLGVHKNKTSALP